MDHFYVLLMSCVFMLSRLFIAALCSPAGKGLTSWLLFVIFNSVFVTFPCGILGQVWYLRVSNPDLCRLSYFIIMRNYVHYVVIHCAEKMELNGTLQEKGQVHKGVKSANAQY